MKFLEVEVRPFVRFSLHSGVRDKTLLGDTMPNAKSSNTLDRAAKLHNFPIPLSSLHGRFDRKWFGQSGKTSRFRRCPLFAAQQVVSAETKSGRQRTSSLSGFISKRKNLLRISSPSTSVSSTQTATECSSILTLASPPSASPRKLT